MKLVQKFGGTSLASIERIGKAAEIAVSAASDGHEIVAVVSAMGQTTDELIALAKQVSQVPNSRELDMLLATGEQQSIALMTMAIQKLGWQARSFTGGQAGIVTEGQYGAARIKEIEAQAIQSTLNRGEIAVVAGFQGITANHEVTTLGRGGSDTTAVALAQAIEADRCDIYTDVRGVYTADPHLVPQARKLDCISYEEMLVLASTGAQVLNHQAAELAMETRLAMRIRSAFAPDDQGTLITHRLLAPDYIVCSMSLDINQVFFRLKIRLLSDDLRQIDATSSLFIRLAELNINTDMVMLLAREDEPYQELVFTVAKGHAEKVNLILASYEQKLGRPEVNQDEKLARLSIVGRRFAGHPEIIASIFDTLSEANIPVQMVTIGDFRMSILIPTELSNLALTQLHNALNLSIDT